MVLELLQILVKTDTNIWKQLTGLYFVDTFNRTNGFIAQFQNTPYVLNINVAFTALIKITVSFQITLSHSQVFGSVLDQQTASRC